MSCDAARLGILDVYRTLRGDVGGVSTGNDGSVGLDLFASVVVELGVAGGVLMRSSSDGRGGVVIFAAKRGLWKFWNQNCSSRWCFALEGLEEAKSS